MESGCDPSSSSVTAAHFTHYHHHRPFACPLLNSTILAPSPCLLHQTHRHQHHHHHHHHFTPPFLCPFHSPLHHCLSPPPPFPPHSTSQPIEPTASQPWLVEDQTLPLQGEAEGEEQEEEEPVFVMTDEWMEFFAKSEAKRRLNKKKKKQKEVN